MRHLARRVGRRGAALLFFALLDFVVCFSLLFPSQAARRSGSFRFIADVIPLWAWACLWACVGAICLVSAFRRRDQWGFTCAIGLKVLWGLVYALGQAVAGLERGYVSATVWLAFAALVGLLSTWPEPPRGSVWTPPSR